MNIESNAQGKHQIRFAVNYYKCQPPPNDLNVSGVAREPAASEQVCDNDKADESHFLMTVVMVALL